MSNGTLARVAAKTAAEVCKNFGLADDAKPLLREGMTPKEFLDALLESKQYYTAMSFLAHALPKREAIWWGLQCAREATAMGPASPAVAAALLAAEKWVANPSEDLRRPAAAAWEAATLATTAGCIAAAVGFTGGSLGPPNVPRIPPGEYAPAVCVAGTVMLAGVADPMKVDETNLRYLKLGIDVANGTSRWG